MAQITARSLYLVFEHLDLDLKKYMDCNKDFCKNHGLVKVRASCVTPGAACITGQCCACACPGLLRSSS